MKKIISISILIVLVLGQTSCQKGKKILKVTAHRGASGLAPENTKTAIVIGHDNPKTAKILAEEMIRWRSLGVTFVRLSDLFEN